MVINPMVESVKNRQLPLRKLTWKLKIPPKGKGETSTNPPSFGSKCLLVPDAALPDARAAALLAFSCLPLLHPRFDGISRDGRGFKIFRQQLSQDIVSVFDIICVPRSKLCLFLFAATKYLQKHSSQCCTA